MVPIHPVSRPQASSVVESRSTWVAPPAPSCWVQEGESASILPGAALAGCIALEAGGRRRKSLT